MDILLLNINVPNSIIGETAVQVYKDLSQEVGKMKHMLWLDDILWMRLYF